MKAELLRGGRESGASGAYGVAGPSLESGGVAGAPQSAEPEGSAGQAPVEGPGTADDESPEETPNPSGRMTGSVSREHIEAILSGLQRSKLALSSALQRADEWRLEGSTLVISFTSRYLSDVVQSDLPTVMDKARQIITPELTIQIETREDSETSEPAESDEETRVDMVRRVFRGEVIQGEE
jgi:DNA polymerase-3 subunit gamma/tau